MDKQKIIRLINRSDKVQVVTVPSIATSQQSEDALKAIKDTLRKNAGKEVVIVQILTK